MYKYVKMAREMLKDRSEDYVEGFDDGLNIALKIIRSNKLDKSNKV